MSYTRIAQARLSLDDPHNCTDVNDTLTVLEALYDALVRRGETEGFAPGLASAWEVADKGRSWLFHLREGVRFHDGSPLDAGAVIASLARMARPDMGVTLGAPGVYSQYLTGANFEAPTPSSVRIVLAEPMADLLDLLVYGYIVAPSVLDDPLARPCGTGPYIFERAGDGYFRARANPDHFGGPPAHEGIEWRRVSAAKDRLAALEGGDTEVANTLPFGVEPTGATAQTYLSPTTIIYLFNAAAGPLRDGRIRRALNLALDRDALIADVLGGAGAALHGFLSPAHSGYVAEGQPAPRPDEARALLREAGVERGLMLDVDCPTSLPNEAEALTAAIAAQLASFGVVLNVKIHEDREAYAHRVRRSEIADMCVFDSSPLSTFRVLCEKIDSRVQGSWWLGYANPAVERLIDSARVMIDDAARAEIFRECHQLLSDDPPWLFVYNHLRRVALRGAHPDWRTRRDGVLDVRSLPRFGASTDG
ncbi:peptide ABC transporter substrate-binding protein [Pelagibius litoralis]|uniref:Peptide ABC transporter substrate-binding protein n=1 Tax=Pelagibius litoralis TaxID=374515 RepID=A0A967C769_9PROT|nr:ABC transporter substrate-binding protein [Pelagibius litoralis]NIA67842.1 peptide ABC transporter substrate-binding protein [Pelagibius litoralis]